MKPDVSADQMVMEWKARVELDKLVRESCRRADTAKNPLDRLAFWKFANLVQRNAPALASSIARP